MFSVVIPAYNCEKTIEEVLNSVKEQTVFDLIEEIIIINDGSTDGTDRVIKQYISKNEQMPIIYMKQENHGVSHTRNKGILKAKAEWIALLDADDLWIKDKLEKQVKCLKENPSICFLGATYPLKFLIGKKRGLYKVSAKQLCIRSCPPTPSVIFKKEIGIQLGLFDEERRYCEDIQFYQRFLLKDSYYILAQNLIVVSYAKKFFAESGLTSNLKEMHKGRNQNTCELYEMGLISKPFLILMLMLNQLKYVRRRLIRLVNKIRRK